VDHWRTAPALKQWLTDIRTGHKEDKYNWMQKV
jgi:branched-chain amino acid aminotransferase